MKAQDCKYKIGDIFLDKEEQFHIEIVGFQVLNNDIYYIFAPIIDPLSFSHISESELNEMERLDIK